MSRFFQSVRRTDSQVSDQTYQLLFVDDERIRLSTGFLDDVGSRSISDYDDHGGFSISKRVRRRNAARGD